MRLALMRRLVVFAGMIAGGFPALGEDPNPATLHSRAGAWPLYRQWTVTETGHYARWIEHLYETKVNGALEQRLAKLERLLTDPEMNLLLDPAFAGEPSNPQLDLGTIRSLHSVVDCAKLAVALSTYYAYRRGLPWMFSYVRACDGGDVRTAEYTIPGGSAIASEYPSERNFFLDAVTGVCTGNFRVEPEGKNAELSDTVPVAIDLEHLRPGCMYYLDGHVLILAQIDPYGEPRFLDATVAASRDIYTFNSLNVVTGIPPRPPGDQPRPYAGCFRGFRMFRYPIAETDAQGNVKRVRRRSDAEMQAFGYSREQYDVMRELLDTQHIRIDDVRLESFHQFVRYRLRSAPRLDLAQEIRNCAQALLGMLETREAQVQAAWREVRQHGPIAFPEGQGISSTAFTINGRWGAYSSAVQDTELRAKYFQLASQIESGLPWFNLTLDYLHLEPLNKHAIWTHADFAAALTREKNRVFGETSITYANSADQPVRLSLLDIERRLFDLSFDPNHPPELRWGAVPGSGEAKNAPEMPTPLPKGKQLPMAEAYAREAYYRSLTQREVEESYLDKMATQGFPMRDKIDTIIAARWLNEISPPLVPHEGKLAYLKKQAQMPQ